MLTPDEYERQLVDDCAFAALNFDDQNYYAKWEEEFHTALKAYADWLRLRAVAGEECYHVWNGSWWDCDVAIDERGVCKSCNARRRMVEILAEQEAA